MSQGRLLLYLKDDKNDWHTIEEVFKKCVSTVIGTYDLFKSTMYVLVRIEFSVPNILSSRFGGLPFMMCYQFNQQCESLVLGRDIRILNRDTSRNINTMSVQSVVSKVREREELWMTKEELCIICKSQRGVHSNTCVINHLFI